MITNIREQVKLLRRSNMVRHNYVSSPLLNYTKYGIEEVCSYLDPDIFPEHEENNSDFSIVDCISPRFVNFHEVVLAIYRDELNSNTKSHGKIFDFDTLLAQVDTNFKKVNNKEANTLKSLQIENRRAKTLKEKDDLDALIRHLKFGSTTDSKELCIGLVNMQLDDKHIEQSYLQDPIFNQERKETFNNLLNLVQQTERQLKKKIDVLIFPELSVPYKALDWICDYAQRNQILMIFGVEHWVCNNIAYNLVVSLIPFNVKGFDDTKESYNALFPLFRIKNHYAPQEEAILKSYRYEIPKPKPYEYFLLEWKGVHFSIFNCFELADIRHRALFRSLVDVLFACEYNADTHYYSNIVESVVRDIHCYFVQSNNAIHGDSRITKPTKTVAMNQIQIKGGKNISVIVDTIDIEAIRDFQIQNFVEYNKNITFKPTPPGYEVEKAMSRKGKQLNKIKNKKTL